MTWIITYFVVGFILGSTYMLVEDPIYLVSDATIAILIQLLWGPGIVFSLCALPFALTYFVFCGIGRLFGRNA